MQIGRHLRDYNADHPDNRVFVIEYDDFNVFLDRFRDTFRRRRVEKVLGRLKVWDHLDAILALERHRSWIGCWETRRPAMQQRST